MRGQSEGGEGSIRGRRGVNQRGARGQSEGGEGSITGGRGVNHRGARGQSQGGEGSITGGRREKKEKDSHFHLMLVPSHRSLPTGAIQHLPLSLSLQ